MADTIMGIIIIGIFLGVIYRYYREYKNTEYYKMTHNSLWSLYFDKGKRGEYHLYRNLSVVTGNKKYLFNCYIPKDDGTTTEIDIILLHDSGIYVFESKNYSGWIFGKEGQREWTEVFPAGRGRSRKEHFINPVIQNKVHLKWLKAYLAEYEGIPYYSYIVFGGKCELKDITLESSQHYVLKQYELLRCLERNISNGNNKLEVKTMEKIYEKLYPLTQVDDTVKTAHIKRVDEKREAYSQPLTVSVNDRVQRKNNENMRICPKCGAKMVVRTAHKGQYVGKKFFGCSNYPYCKHIETMK